MSVNVNTIRAMINLDVRADPVKAFQNLNINRILLLMCDAIDGTGGTGAGTGLPSVTRKVSADFANATDCAITLLNGANLAIYMSEAGRFIEKDAGEWADLVGGGFRVLISGFDSTASNYHFYIFTL